MKKKSIERLVLISIVLIVVALILWSEISFFLGGLGIVLLGVSEMLYLHNKK